MFIHQFLVKTVTVTGRRQATISTTFLPSPSSRTGKMNVPTTMDTLLTPCSAMLMKYMFAINKLDCHINMLICSCHPELPCLMFTHPWLLSCNTPSSCVIFLFFLSSSWLLSCNTTLLILFISSSWLLSCNTPSSCVGYLFFLLQHLFRQINHNLLHAWQYLILWVSYSYSSSFSSSGSSLCTSLKRGGEMRGWRRKQWPPHWGLKWYPLSWLMKMLLSPSPSITANLNTLMSWQPLLLLLNHMALALTFASNTKMYT